MRQTANAFPTCEGALQLAMEQTAFTLQNARCLVIGAGRIGMLLARKLYALDAQVTVKSAMHAEQKGELDVLADAIAASMKQA